MENQFERLLQQVNDNTNKRMSELKEEFVIHTNNLAAQMTSIIEDKLKPLIDENKKLKNEMELLHNKVGGLEREVRRNNVLMHGVEEEERTNAELLQLVLNTLSEMAKEAEIENFDKWEISEVRRLGKKEENRRRPILIKLTLAWRRTEILKNNKKFPKNIYITEDFPKEILKTRKELKIKQQEEIKKGNLAFIRYDKLIIKENPNQNGLFKGNTERENSEYKRKRSPTKSPTGNATKLNAGTAGPSKINKNKSYDIFRHRANSNPNPNQQ